MLLPAELPLRESPAARASSPAGAEPQRDIDAVALPLLLAPGAGEGFGLPETAGEEPGRVVSEEKCRAPEAEAGLESSSAATCARVVPPLTACEVASGSLLTLPRSSTDLKPSVSSACLTSPKFLSEERNLLVISFLKAAVVSCFSQAGFDWTAW